MINTDALRQINYVIEHDVVSSTYKYVLLISVINACQKYEHIIQTDDDTAKIPLGIIVEQWIFDYMPFVFKNISQQNNGNVLDNPIVSNYNAIFDVLQLDRSIDWEYAYMQFRKAYEDPAKPSLLSTLFLKLAKKIATKIVNMPMKHIGQSHYELFSPDRLVFGNIHLLANQYYDTNFIVRHFDYFSISRQHYNVFRYLGQTLYGTSTIISKWKEKTKALNDEQSSSRDMIDKLSGDVLEIRNTSAIRAILSQEKECVWSGKRLKGENYDVDHVLPFSVWLNNDLWNMLPTNRKLNQQQKKTKIPTPSLIERRAEVIKHYWNQYITRWPALFKAQVELSLTGSNIPTERLADEAIESLCKKSHYLIYDRGHEQFDI